MRLPFTLILILIVLGDLQSQNISKEVINEFVTRYKPLDSEKKSNYKINNLKPVTSISVKFSGYLKGSYIIANNQKYTIIPDEHRTGEYMESSLIIFDEPIFSFEIETGESLDELIEISAIHAPEFKKELFRVTEDFDCSTTPDIIPQSSWRSGLPAPSSSRAYTTTRNVIVHHSATANNLTNYTNVVRNIYLFHTQDRGWSDVGYNYLIAPNGVIYSGRDPLQGEQDLVLGAHFCGRNSNTMGICLLGNLSLVEPAEEALESLEKLISWKLVKDELDPLGINSHPLNNTLPVIAGHRDGCATQCPGNFTYPRLEQVRIGVESLIDACQQELEIPEERNFSFGPNPSTINKLNISLPENVLPSDVTFTNLSGQNFALKLTFYNVRSMQLDLSPLPNGIYIMSIDTKDFQTTKRIVKQ